MKKGVRKPLFQHLLLTFFSFFFFNLQWDIEYLCRWVSKAIRVVPLKTNPTEPWDDDNFPWSCMRSCRGSPCRERQLGRKSRPPLSRGCAWAQMLPRRKGVAQTVREGALPLAMCLRLSPSQAQSRGDDPPEGSTFWFKAVFVHCSLTQQQSKTEQIECFHAWSLLYLQALAYMSVVCLRIPVYLNLCLYL